MLKTLFTLFFLLITFNTQASSPTIISSAEEETLIEDKIYFFAHALNPRSKTAYDYISKKYSHLDIPIIDMNDKHNFELYKECVKKFNIPNNQLTLPLFCLKNDYVMGWTYGSETLLDKAIKNHQIQQ